MDSALQAIAEPTRRRILQLVWDRELPAGEIAKQFQVTRPAISQHLRVLKDVGLLSERRQGTRRYYRARPEGLEEVRAFFESLWDDSLARLKEASEAAAAQRQACRPAPTTSGPQSPLPMVARPMSSPTI